MTQSPADILMVDDEHKMRNNPRIVFEAASYEVEVAV